MLFEKTSAALGAARRIKDGLIRNGEGTGELRENTHVQMCERNTAIVLET